MCGLKFIDEPAHCWRHDFIGKFTSADWTVQYRSLSWAHKVSVSVGAVSHDKQPKHSIELKGPNKEIRKFWQSVIVTCQWVWLSDSVIQRAAFEKAYHDLLHQLTTLDKYGWLGGFLKGRCHHIVFLWYCNRVVYFSHSLIVYVPSLLWQIKE